MKTYSRAKQKAEHDYYNEIFPKSACVLDLIRCTLVFNNISTLLNALNLLVKKISYFQSGNIIGIVRIKNSFKNYSIKSQYCDIKLNVLIKGKINNIIGEIQFLLKPMLNYKKEHHSLYSIERQKEFFDEALFRILPQLLSKDKQLFVAGNLGNVSKLCQTIVLNNMSREDIVHIDKISKESILNNICSLNNVKAIKFLISIIPNDLLMDRLCTPNRYNSIPLESAVKHNHTSILNEIFTIDKMVKKCQTDKDLLFRLIHDVVHKNMFTFLISKLNLSKKKLVELLNHKYSYILHEKENCNAKSLDSYVDGSILTHIGSSNKSVDILKVLISVIGEKELIKHAFIAQYPNTTIIENAIRKNKIEMIEFLFSFDSVCDTYKKENFWICRLLFWLEKCKESSSCKESVEYIISKLGLTKEKVTKSLQEYQYKEKFKFDKERVVTSLREYLFYSFFVSNVNFFKLFGFVFMFVMCT